MKGTRGLLLAAWLCGGALTACGDASEHSDGPAPTTKKSSAPKVPGLPPEMVSAVSSGRTATKLSVHFALRATPTINKPLPIDIAMVPHGEFTSLRAHFESHDGLEVTTGNVYGPVTDLPVEKARTHQIVLLPSKEGVYMVTGILETEGEDGTVSRIFSIPVIVSVPDAKPAATVATPAPPATKGAAAPDSGQH